MLKVWMVGPRRTPSDREALERARKRWEAEGWIVVTPEGVRNARSVAKTMVDCHAIAVLPAWRDDADSLADLQLARLIGLDTYDAATHDKL